ncbi:MAG: hypothetical protein IJ191_04155 [Treponema sp.]|nr:hypothetical protein [Treponema sp.]
METTSYVELHGAYGDKHKIIETRSSRRKRIRDGLFTALIAFGISGCISTARHETTPEPPLPDVVPVEYRSPENQAFLERIDGITLRITGRPAATRKNRAFSRPYTVTVTDSDGAPVTDFPLALSYPSARQTDGIQYATELRVTDGSGTVTFTPPVPAFAVDDVVSVAPAPPAAPDNAVTKAVQEKTVNAPYQVSTDYAGANGILYVFDYNQAGRATANSLAFLRAMRNNGFNVGNSPLNSSTYLDGPVSTIYARTKAIVGNAYTLMVSGRVQYAAPVAVEQRKYTVSLTASITVTAMATGAVLLETTQTHSVTARTEDEALSQCREQLAEHVVRFMLYNL